MVVLSVVEVALSVVEVVLSVVEVVLFLVVVLSFCPTETWLSCPCLLVAFVAVDAGHDNLHHLACSTFFDHADSCMGGCLHKTTGNGEPCYAACLEEWCPDHRHRFLLLSLLQKRWKLCQLSFIQYIFCHVLVFNLYFLNVCVYGSVPTMKRYVAIVNSLYNITSALN